jgi:hypothetical protein
MAVGSTNILYPDVFHSGIGVGFGGTFSFCFAFNTGLLPSEFFEMTRHYGHLRMNWVELEIVPISCRPTPWTVNTATADGDGTVTVQPTSALPEANGVTALGAVLYTKPALTSFSTECYWNRTPLNLWMDRMLSPQYVWNHIGVVDALKLEPIANLLHRHRVPKVPSNATVRCRRRFHELELLADDDPGFLRQGGPIDSSAPIVVRQYVNGPKRRPLKPIRIPPGGFRNHLYPGIADIAAYIPTCLVPFGEFIVDTNKWTVEYVNRGAGNLQKFNVDAAAFNPAMMNPPMEWTVRMTCSVSMWGAPVQGATDLGLLDPAGNAIN